MIIYGIKNCDTMHKAIKWLQTNKYEFNFYDYKVSGIGSEKLKQWVKKSSLTQLLNIKSTSYRNLTEAEKELLNKPQTALKLMVKYPTLIKRPVLEHGETLLIGFKEDEWLAKLV